ncbi:MAG TPA: hypothetical protein VFC25_18245 [Verrucomicrobiae bacterium]|nr:hypothetical protein [Verrucomicrobiae bacterium]
MTLKSLAMAIAVLLIAGTLLIHASSKMRADGLRRVIHLESTSSLTTMDGLELAVASRKA